MKQTLGILGLLLVQINDIASLFISFHIHNHHGDASPPILLSAWLQWPTSHKQAWRRHKYMSPMTSNSLRQISPKISNSPPISDLIQVFRGMPIKIQPKVADGRSINLSLIAPFLQFSKKIVYRFITHGIGRKASKLLGHGCTNRSQDSNSRLHFIHQPTLVLKILVFYPIISSKQWQTQSTWKAFYHDAPVKILKE